MLKMFKIHLTLNLLFCCFFPFFMHMLQKFNVLFFQTFQIRNVVFGHHQKMKFCLKIKKPISLHHICNLTCNLYILTRYLGGVELI